MHLHEILATELQRFKDQPINIVETGTIRGTSEPSRVGDGWSTLFFAQWVQKFGGEVTSIDLKTGTVPLVLAPDELRFVVLLEEHSISALAKLLAKRDTYEIDIAFLDSDNDPQLILHEFLIAEQLVVKRGLIIIDDVWLTNHSSAEPRAKKGDLVLPWVRERGYKLRMHERDGWAGYKAGVLVIEV